MGSACCVAAREPITKGSPRTKGSPSEALQSHARRSPSWSFRWDNRRRVAGEEPSEDWMHDGGGGSHPLDAKSGATVEISSASEGGSQLDSFKSLVWQKSPASEGNTGILRHPSSDPSISQSSAEVKESTESPAVLYPSPAKLSPSAPFALSLTTSPLSSKIHHLPPNSTPSRWRHHSPGHQLLRHVSDSWIPECKSPAFSISEEASSLLLPTRGSNDGSLDSWSSPAFSELTRTRRERWSFDSQQILGSPSLDLQTCGVCSKLLTDRSSWGGQKLVVTTEIDVVAVLICGHVFHAECLEFMTAEINKYDPICPVCTLGEKISKKALKAEMDLKARKQSRNRVVDSNLIELDHDKSSGHDGTNPKISSSSSVKSSLGNHFLRRHLSIGSKEIRSFSENHSTQKKGFFWMKSSKISKSDRSATGR